MSIKIAAVAGAAVSAIVLMMPVEASAQRGGGYNVPQGSYARSCNDISVSGGRLFAQCTDMRSNRQYSSIDASACRGDISNNNGLLSCAGATGRFERGNGGGSNGRPGGNDGRPGGGWDNDNGGRPGGGRPGGGGWDRPGSTSITVYRDANFRGQSQTFDGEISNLGRSGMNDAISSMRMRGRWLACTDSNFRGQCMEFDGEVTNLSRFRMNDQISSLRPVWGGGRR